MQGYSCVCEYLSVYVYSSVLYVCMRMHIHTFICMHTFYGNGVLYVMKYKFTNFRNLLKIYCLVLHFYIFHYIFHIYIYIYIYIFLSFFFLFFLTFYYCKCFI